MSATAASTCTSVFVRRFGWNIETDFLLSLAALGTVCFCSKNCGTKLSVGGTK